MADLLAHLAARRANERAKKILQDFGDDIDVAEATLTLAIALATLCLLQPQPIETAKKTASHLTELVTDGLANRDGSP